MDGRSSVLGQPGGLLPPLQPEEGGQNPGAGKNEVTDETSTAALYSLHLAPGVSKGEKAGRVGFLPAPVRRVHAARRPRLGVGVGRFVSKKA